MKRTGPTDTNLRKVILEFKKTKKYSDLVRVLEKPRRKKEAVNIKDIDELGKDKVATNYVLSVGNLTKPVTVYSWKYSKLAKEKIEKAGGKALSLDDLLRNKDQVAVI